MSLQLDDDLYEILMHVSGGHTPAWATQTIVKLVLDNQHLRKMVKVNKALEPNQYDKHRDAQMGLGSVYDEQQWLAQQKAKLHAHNYNAMNGLVASEVNSAAVKPREILNKYKSQYLAVDEFIPSIDDVIKDSTPKGGSDVGG